MRCIYTRLVFIQLWFSHCKLNPHRVDKLGPSFYLCWLTQIQQLECTTSFQHKSFITYPWFLELSISLSIDFPVVGVESVLESWMHISDSYISPPISKLLELYDDLGHVSEKFTTYKLNWASLWHRKISRSCLWIAARDHDGWCYYGWFLLFAWNWKWLNCVHATIAWCMTDKACQMLKKVFAMFLHFAAINEKPHIMS